MDSPKGETPQTERTFEKVRILKMDSPKGETPQTEGYIYTYIYTHLYPYVYS